VVPELDREHVVNSCQRHAVIRKDFPTTLWHDGSELLQLPVDL
jgi:hypothetical protein